MDSINIYSFHELGERAQERALADLSDVNIFYRWWELLAEEAEGLGFEVGYVDVRRKIISVNYTGKAFGIYDKVRAKYDEVHPLRIIVESVETTDVVAATRAYFINAIISEYYYRVSDAGIIETIQVNDWSFLADGTQVFNLKHQNVA